MEQINQELRSGFIEKAYLEDYLKAIPDNHFGSISAHLLGWVVSDEPECFFWRTDYPHEVYWGEPRAEGSGQKTLDFMLRRVPKLKPNLPPAQNFEQGRSFALHLCGGLMADEISGINFRDKSFGHAYEILYHDGKCFKYVPSVLYTRIDCHYKNGILFSSRIYDNVYKYQHFKNISFLQNFNLKDGTIKNSVIEPVFAAANYRNISFAIPATMQSFIYFILLTLTNDERSGALVSSCNYEEGTIGAPIQIERKGSKESIALNSNFTNYVNSLFNNHKSSDFTPWR